MRKLTLLLAILPLVWASPAILPQERPPRLHAGKVEVTLVLLDTVVTDRKGNPVSGLRIEDFDLLIDNVGVPIDAIEQRCEEAPASGAVEAVTTAAAPAAAPRQFIILFDLSHMLVASRNNAIRAAIQFVDEGMAAEDRVMVLAFMRGLHVISGFTTDRPGLRARLQRLLEDKSMVDPAPFEEENRLAQIVVAQRQASAQALRRGSIPALAAGGITCVSEAIEAEYQAARTLRALANAMPAFGGPPAGRHSSCLPKPCGRARGALSTTSAARGGSRIGSPASPPPPRSRTFSSGRTWRASPSTPSTPEGWEPTRSTHSGTRPATCK